jgi:hypothetical protein
MWTFGKKTQSQFTTYAYGHPRKETIDLLTLILNGLRTNSIKAKVAMGPRKFIDYVIQKKIYATAWDRNIEVIASLDGNYQVLIEN